jgi:biotin transport system substrate-specific component
MRLNTKDMLHIALFASLTSIKAFIKIETPLVPITLQFAFCAYAGLILGAKKGMAS